MSVINLLPEDYIEGRKLRRTSMVCLPLFVVAIISMAAVAIISNRSVHHTQQVESRVRQDYEKAAKLIQQMYQLESEKHVFEQKALAATPLMERVPRSTLLAVVTNALPKHAALVRFDLETKLSESSGASSARTGQKGSKFAKVSSGRSANSSKKSVVTLKITGQAGTDVDVARFIANLARNPLMESVDLVYSQEKKSQKNERPIREFQIKIELVQDADAITIVSSLDKDKTTFAPTLTHTQPGDEK